ncbi:hypothetical protein [Maribacter hydrothermalis]|uniref:META domain-containing protein n=1 Tax=Maribacter hydrothermalis TaxID=1836467 RepID=A0A1B7Z3Z3_9FLAO|nr:hypothetical protein [Maribacter hydrothermalis]APQ17168.1 hypothetical protein BTR34_07430 [Maribacter hydrothermalis]OBR37429.1 hypothetical protein A9200_07180 [Maribacter hydrothermalis]
MKTPFLIVVLVLFTLNGCNTANNADDIEGYYTGTFQRGEIISNVTLNLNGKNFSGESDIAKFPAICNGNFTILNDMVTFDNLCPWTAEFDWSLILSNEWHFTIDYNKLTLTNSIGDIYILTK